MKTMKYRSVFSTICAVTLSVFLFTACEKESDNIGSVEGDRLEKFKRLKFTANEPSGSNTSGTGKFVSGGGNVTFVPASGSGNSSQFSPIVNGGGEFTNPMSTGSSFAVANPLSIGGGSFTLGTKTYQMDFGFCASSALFGAIDGPNGNDDELEVFIGVSGDFDVSAGTGDPEDLGLDLILYVFSYNGSNNIGDFGSFDGEGDPANSAFVIAVTNFDEDGGDIYFSKSGNVDFGGSNVSLSGLTMAKILEDIQEGNVLGTTTVRASGALECGSISFDEED